MFFRGSTKRIRKRILQGIFEQNLRILGHKPLVSGRRFRLWFRPGAVAAAVLLLMVLANALHLDSRSPAPMPEAAAPPSAAPNRWTGAALDPGSVIPAADYSEMAKVKSVPIKEMFGLGVRTIIIDPGHGGGATGASGHQGTREKELTLDIARRLKTLLEQHTGYQILMTREDDSEVPLRLRAELANTQNADLFVSIHVNALEADPKNIIETYYFGPSSDRADLALAAAENEGSDYSISDYNRIIKEIGDALKYQESKNLAAAIQKSLFNNLKKVDGDVLDFGIKRAPFVVLLGVEMPAVLVEVSTLSNRNEEARLRDAAYREKIAGYLESGIITYLNHQRSNS